MTEITRLQSEEPLSIKPELRCSHQTTYTAYPIILLFTVVIGDISHVIIFLSKIDFSTLNNYR